MQWVQIYKLPRTFCHLDMEKSWHWEAEVQNVGAGEQKLENSCLFAHVADSSIASTAVSQQSHFVPEQLLFLLLDSADTSTTSFPCPSKEPVALGPSSMEAMMPTGLTFLPGEAS